MLPFKYEKPRPAQRNNYLPKRNASAYASTCRKKGRSGNLDNFKKQLIPTKLLAQSKPTEDCFALKLGRPPPPPAVRHRRPPTGRGSSELSADLVVMLYFGLTCLIVSRPSRFERLEVRVPDLVFLQSILVGRFLPNQKRGEKDSTGGDLGLVWTSGGWFSPLPSTRTKGANPLLKVANLWAKWKRGGPPQRIWPTDCLHDTSTLSQNLFFFSSISRGFFWFWTKSFDFSMFFRFWSGA